jgi:hypothetical protein
MAEDEEPKASAQLSALIISNAERDRLIAELGAQPLAEGEVRPVAEGVCVSLSQSQPAGFDSAFCLNSGGRIYFFFRRPSDLPLFNRSVDSRLIASSPIRNVVM